ncbi:pyridoxal phosphate-dependent transferase [Ochromonadaceae sp. CCMP2298]|nr:pyridoxal phosphate-dependent transferase [Ochromonadaceae sp. CCMP2298]
MAGGVCKFVPIELDPSGVGSDGSQGKWELDMNKLEAAVTPKTKLMLINTPHNPTGKVFTLEELQAIAHILERHPHVTAVMDEVYEKLVFDGREHIRLASLPGMWERCLTVSSCGKTFSATGWKVGWVYGAADLVKPIVLANQWIQYCVSAPTQRALSSILAQADRPYKPSDEENLEFPSYYAYVCDEYVQKRNALAQMLRMGNIHPYMPEGGFFIMADTSKYEVPDEYVQQPGPNGEVPVTRDWGFARWLTVEKGITPIPPSAFYTPATKHLAANLARFAFCKKEESLIAAQQRFKHLAQN